MNHETILIGQIVLSKGEFFDDLTITENYFQDPLNRRIFRAVKNVTAQGTTPDLITITDSDSHIPPAKLSEIADSGQIHTTANWSYYEKSLLNRYTAHELKNLGLYLSENAGNIDQAIEHAEGELSRLQSQSEKDIIIERASALLDYTEKLEERYRSGGQLPGFSTGFPAIDSHILGLQKTNVYQIGGRPSAGKSALLLQIANNLSLDKKVPVGFFSLESGQTSIFDRTISSRAKIDSQKIKTGALDRRDFDKITTVNTQIFDSKFYIHDTPNEYLPRIESVARQMVRRFGVQVLFVDYLQLIRVPGAKDRREQTERASLAMKELARRLEIPIVLAAQLGRDSSGRIPTLADFQHSSQIEQDGDAAILLHEDKDRQKWAIIAKVRDGEKGQVKLDFFGRYVTFAEAVA